MATIYFDEDSRKNAKEYAGHARAQHICNKISDGIEKAAIIACSLVSVVAISILIFVLTI